MTKPSATPPRELLIMEPGDSDLQESGPYYWYTIEIKPGLDPNDKIKKWKDKGFIHVIEHSALIEAKKQTEWFSEELRYYKNEFESCAHSRTSFTTDLQEQYRKIEGLEFDNRKAASNADVLLNKINELEKERDNLKWEYDNVCKFANDNEERIEGLEAELAITKSRLNDYSIDCPMCGQVGKKEIKSNSRITVCPDCDHEWMTGRDCDEFKNKEIKSLRERVEVCKGALKSLANEAKGFLSMANPADHGNTNIAVLQHWIDNARAALAKLEVAE